MLLVISFCLLLNMTLLVIYTKWQTQMFNREFKGIISELRHQVNHSNGPAVTTTKSKAIIVDPDDPAQQIAFAKQEHEEMMQKLNGKT